MIAFPDTEAVVRAWIRSLDLPDVGGKVFFAIPKRPTFPLVSISRLGDRPDRYTPVDTALISCDVWCNDSHGGKNGAFKIAGLLAAHLNDPAAYTHTSDGVSTVIDGGDVTLGPLWRPDEEAHLARYVVDATITCRVVQTP